MIRTLVFNRSRYGVPVDRRHRRTPLTPPLLALLLVSVGAHGCAESPTVDAGDVADAAAVDQSIRVDGGADADAADSADGGPLDAGPDDVAGVDDAGLTPKRVTIAVVEPGSSDPAEGAQVIFHDEDGVVLMTALTDATGRVSGTLPRRGMITIIRNSREQFTAQTWMALDGPEQMSREYLSRVIGDNLPVLQVPFEVPPTPSFDVVYIASGGRGTPFAGTSGLVGVYPSGLNSNQRFNLVAFGHPTIDAPPSAYSLQLDLPIGSTPVLMPAWQTDLQSTQFHWTQGFTPADELNISSEFLIGELRYGDYLPRAVDPRTAGQTAVYFPPDIATAHSYETRLFDSARSRQSVVSVLSTAAPDRVDVGAAPGHLGFVDSVAIDYAPLNRPIISYVAGQAAEDADVVSIQLDYAAQKGAKPHRWILHLPARMAASVQFPELPALTSATSAPYDSVFNDFRVTLTDYDFLAGYAALQSKWPPVLPETYRIRQTVARRQ